MTHTVLRWGAAIAGSAILAAAPAAAQDPDAPPAYGSVSLTAGFPDDPHSVAVQAGGAMDAGRVSDGCWGYVSYMPSVVLDYDAGGFPLLISAASDADGVLMIQAPNGDWVCDDDSAGNLNPGVTFDEPASGRYAIWVGDFDGDGYSPAMLHISEIEYSTRNDYSRAPDPDAAPTHGQVSLQAGFADDPRTFGVTAGGDIEIDRYSGDSGCAGFVADRPSVVIDYEAGDYPLFFSMETDDDGTIAVHTPDGDWVCDDDNAGDLNPGVRIETPSSGRYAVFAGSFGDGGIPNSTLYVSELGYLGEEFETVDWAAEPLHGAVELEAGFPEDPYTVDVTAGGDLDAYDAVGAECVGFTTSEPTFDLYYEAGSFDLYISAIGDEDLTIVVNAPDGSWWCDDDSAGDLNPGLRFDAPQSGLYDIWVGTYGEPWGDGPVDATIHISEIGFTESEFETIFDIDEEAELDLFADPAHGMAALEAGFLPDPYVVEVSAGGDMSAQMAIDANYETYCPGQVTAEADFELDYTADGRSLFLSILSDTDSTLVVNAPDGSWICDDDGGAGFDAGMEITDPQSGIYDIWVGTFGDMPITPAELHISEIGLAED